MKHIHVIARRYHQVRMGDKGVLFLQGWIENWERGFVLAGFWVRRYLFIYSFSSSWMKAAMYFLLNTTVIAILSLFCTWEMFSEILLPLIHRFHRLFGPFHEIFTKLGTACLFCLDIWYFLIVVFEHHQVSLIICLLLKK